MPVTTRTSLGSQSWRPARTSRALKDTLEERVTAFFTQDTHVQLHKNAYLEWTQHTQARKSQWDLRVLLEAIKHLPLTTVKLVSNSAAYKDRIHFLYPFRPEMEHSVPKTPPQSPDTTHVSATETQSERSPDLLTTDLPTTEPRSVPDMDPALPQDSETIENENTQDQTEIFTPLQTLETTLLTPETETQDTEAGVTGRFILNKVKDTFHQEFQEHFKTSFHAQFQESMNAYSDTLDTRIRHVVAEAMDDLYEKKVVPHVKSSVQQMYETVQNATIESLIDDKIGDQIQTSMEQSSIAILENKAATMSETVLNDVIKPEVKTIVTTIKDELTLISLGKMANIKNVVTSAKEEIVKTSRDTTQSLKNQSHTVTQLIGTFKNTYADLVNKTRVTLKSESDKFLLEMSKDANTHLEYIAQESADALQNLSDIVSDRTVTIRKSLAEDLQQAKHKLAENCQRHFSDMKNWVDANINSKSLQTTSTQRFKQGEIVSYTKDDSSDPVPVTIAAVHTDDEGEFFYTVKFPTGLEIQTIPEKLSSDNSRTPMKNVNRFQKVDMKEEQSKVPLKSFYHNQYHKRMTNKPPPHSHRAQQQLKTSDDNNATLTEHTSPNAPIYVDVDEDDDDEPPTQPNPTAHPTRTNNQQYLPETAIVQTGPTPYMVTQFHKHFKGKIENKDMILTFYQQLYAQGKAYGIYVIDIKDIRQDCDLCPDEVSLVARNAMQIALFQKLQDVDYVSSDFKEAQNQIDAYSNTSDGYATLYQLLRMVHPHLTEGSKLYNAPKLSEAKNLSQYAAMCRNYILFQEIQNRTYTEKEKSEMFLQNVDDPEYSAGRAQCITELAIATLDGTTNVRISSMKFSNLPMTLQQYTNKLNISETQPIVRAMHKSSPNNRMQRKSNSSNRMQRNANYEPFLCMGCGMWGHKVTKCKTVPKVAIAQEYIKKKPKHVQKLVSEFKRVNDKSTKRTTVRVLQSNGILDDFEDPDTYLNDNDIDVPMEDIPQMDEE